MSEHLWQKIADSIRQDIESGRLKAGDKVETEARLTKQWGVSAMTVHRAMQELRQQGWIIRQQGRGTIVAEREKKATGDVALIFHNWSNIFELEYMRGIGTGLGDDYRLVYFNANFDAEREAQLLERAVRETDGIISIPLCQDGSKATMGKIANSGFPLVCLDRVPQDIEVDSVMCDNYGNSVAALRFLVEKGHRRIFHLTEPDLCVSTVRERYDAFLDVMSEAGESRPEECIRIFPFGRQSFETVVPLVQDTLFALANQKEPCTAIFCLNDTCLSVVLAAAERMGWNLPQDMEVLAFNDNITLSPQVESRLNRIIQQPFLMGRQAAELLKRRMNGEKSAPQHICVDAEFLPAQGIVSY